MSNGHLVVDIHEAQRILACLEKIRVDRQLVDPGFGLCFNLSYSGCQNGYEVVSALSPKWEHFSGKREWPVPRDGRDEGCKRWEGVQLRYRLSLAAYISCRVSDLLLRAWADGATTIRIPYEPE